MDAVGEPPGAAGDSAMWLEILSRHHDVTARHRCGGSEIRIGRGYDNDVVLDDPYVAPHHLRLYRSAEGGWVAEDLGTANGLLTERGKVRLPRMGLDGNQIFRIGRTLLRLRSPNFAVATERVATPLRTHWPVSVLLAVGIIGIQLVAGRWLVDTTEPHLMGYLGVLVYPVVASAVWVLLWTVLSRVFSGQARFDRHLLFALTGLFSYSALDEVLKLAGYALSWDRLLADEYIAFWVIAALVCLGHMEVIAPKHRRLSGSIVAGLALLAIGMETLFIAESHRNFDPPPAEARLYPPVLRLVPARSEDAFLADVAGLRDKLDADRKEDSE